MFALHQLLFLYVLTGLGSNALGGKIINGEIAPPNTMQFMASVQNSTGHHVCGGFLIRDNFVVTAAHCDTENPTSVVLGTHKLKRVDSKMRHSVTRCKHPCFHDVQCGDDIMLLKLSERVPLGNRVRLIALPEADIKIKDNAKCQVAGWGYTSTGGKAAEVLRVVDVPFVNLELCKKEWMKEEDVDLPDNVICAGGYGTKKGFCQGDSGGPLVCGKTAVGVVSFNLKQDCDYPNVPNVYTDVSKYLHWIEEIEKTC